MTDRILIIDQLNLYLRNYIANPSLSSNGDPVGGIIGSLKSLQKVVRETNPTSIMIVWDGPGGSKRKKFLYKEYKDKRKPIRLNRFVHNLSEEEEARNKVWQMQKLFDYFSYMPMYQFIYEGYEADDIIAYLCFYYRDKQKVILSSDKDFIQLLNDNTLLYRAMQNEILNTKKALNQYEIHPTNFALARAISGDPSDNIKGVPRAGLKTVAKRLPFLKENKFYHTDKVLDFCQQKCDDGVKLKIYKNIIEYANKVKENYNIMQLYNPSISYNIKKDIQKELTEKRKFNKAAVIKEMISDGFTDWNFDNLFARFSVITESQN